VCSHLSTLAAQTAELSPILEIFAEEIECAVTVVNTAFEVLGFAPGAGSRVTAAQLRSDATRSTLRPVLTAAARNRRPLAAPVPASGQMMIVAPVLVGDDVVGYLLTLSPNPIRQEGGPAPSARPAPPTFTEDMRLLAVQHAAMVCGVVLGRVRGEQQLRSCGAGPASPPEYGQLPNPPGPGVHWPVVQPLPRPADG
jgi:hypothetical protein